jgi:hypothetical protein
MPIIIRIRKFLNLEKKTISSDNNFTDSVGLYLTETMLKNAENSPSMDCLVTHSQEINALHDFAPPSNSIDIINHSHDLHFN